MARAVAANSDLTKYLLLISIIDSKYMDVHAGRQLEEKLHGSV